jgi:hypothetical protein
MIREVPCTVIRRTFALPMRRSKLRVKLRGSVGVANRVVNTRRCPPSRRRRARGRARGRCNDGLAVRDRDRRAARGPGAEAAHGGPGREEGRVRLRGRGRDADLHRPGGRGPAVLLRQVQEARHEPAGHRRPRRRHRAGLRALPGSAHGKKAEQTRGVPADWRPQSWSPWAARVPRAARTRSSRTRGRTSRSPRSRPVKRTRSPAYRQKARTPAQDLENPPQAALLPLARRPARQGHPRSATREE